MAYKILDGYEKYVIFSDGRIWSRSKKHFMNPSPNTDGYPQTMFNRKSKTVHILIAKAFVPNPRNLKEVNHKDGVKTNNHYSNLEWVTRGENIKHSYRLGLRNSDGAKKASSKLKEWQVKAIRWLYKYTKTTQKELGSFYGVTQSHIGYIVNNKSWIQ
jgi:hypothetical protein